MEPHGDPNDMPALASATVVMLRDGAHGLEVFLVQRHGLSDVLGGAYVFPGGKVDPADAALSHLLDLPAQTLHAALGEPQLSPAEAAALYVGAIREVVEETGVLYADGAGMPQALARLREGKDFPDALRGCALQLRAALLTPWTRWITPLVGGVVRKRFDTRFFLATVPPGQQPVHDDHEATASTWLSPRQALQQYWAGAIQLAPPQIMSLAQLARHADAASALAEAARRRPPRIQPEPFEQDGVRVICYPGDPRHSIAQAAMPGPTRLCWRNKRFEPEGGGLELLIG
jgi:8-oxo-dGTP pyrophosphatase MutT (NUDIX family)